MFIKKLFSVKDNSLISKFSNVSVAKKLQDTIIPIEFKKILNVSEIPKEKFGVNTDDFSRFARANSIYKTDYKAKCVDALKGKNPKEVVYILDEKSGACLAERIGDASSCVIDLRQINKVDTGGLTLLHGHPASTVNSKTLPISLADFQVINDSKISKIVAYNSKGEQSFLRKNSNFHPLSESEIRILKNRYLEELLNNTSNTDILKKIKELKIYVKQNPNSDAVKHEIARQIDQLQYQNDSSEIIDRFWRKNASSINLTYFSDFNS